MLEIEQDQLIAQSGETTEVNASVANQGSNSESQRRLIPYLAAIKRSGQSALVALELSPANELLRAAAFAAGEAVSRDPLIGAATIGLSTFAIELSGGLAAASLVDTDHGQKIFAKINRTHRLRIPLVNRNIKIPEKLSGATKTGLTFMGGTVVGMALEQRENPTRSIERNRLYSLRTSAWLAGTVAVGGALASEGINIGINDPRNGGLIAAGLVGAAAGGRWLKKHFTKAEVFQPNWHDTDPKTGLTFDLITERDRLAAVAKVEQDVWDEMGYGSLAEYKEAIAHSRTFAAFDGEQCIGLTRMFTGTSELPPFVSSMPFYDEETRVSTAQECEKGETEELGTIAIVKGARNGRIPTRLWRLAYRDGTARGIKSWGIIMEPRRVEIMNRKFGFTFEKLGDPIDYQGGLCAAHIMDLDKTRENMMNNMPETYDWFVNQPLGS